MTEEERQLYVAEAQAHLRNGNLKAAHEVLANVVNVPVEDAAPVKKRTK